MLDLLHTMCTLAKYIRLILDEPDDHHLPPLQHIIAVEVELYYFWLFQVL
jgi:hypothetical protein